MISISSRNYAIDILKAIAIILLRIHISDRYIRIFRHPWQLWASMETHYFLCIRLSAYRQHPQKRQRMELV